MTWDDIDTSYVHECCRDVESLFDQLQQERDALEQKMRDIAHEWRMDWSYFDGRTLVQQVEAAIREAREAKPRE